MATPHVPLPPALRLPPEYAHVQGYLDRRDPDLRIRRSVEWSGFYILERRCRRRPAVNAGMRDRSDMHVQARDGYIHVSSVHPNWLNKPWSLVRALQEEGDDLFAKSATEVHDEQAYEKRWQKETRRRRRRRRFRDIANESYGPRQRRLGSRVSSAGGPTRMNGRIVLAGA